MGRESKSDGRRYSRLDRLFKQVDQALRTSFAQAQSTIDPTDGCHNQELSLQERQHAAGLMRVNHVGEVCAQALYYGQALTARDPAIRAHMIQAASEETDHLAWCHKRLDELGSRPSLLNPLWYAGAFTIGALAGLSGDRRSLGFVMETERQVEAHLQAHVKSLPPGDNKSRAIVERMATDEARHGKSAKRAGGTNLPPPVQRLMHHSANVMRWLAYRI